MSSAGTPFSLSAYLTASRGADGNGPPNSRGYCSAYPVAPRIVCVDGFSLSAQATQGAYCSPRQNVGPWREVEVGFPSAPPELIGHLAEDPDDPTRTVYPYVAVELVERLIEMHGGPDKATRAVIAKATGEQK